MGLLKNLQRKHDHAHEQPEDSIMFRKTLEFVLSFIKTALDEGGKCRAWLVGAKEKNKVKISVYKEGVRIFATPYSQGEDERFIIESASFSAQGLPDLPDMKSIRCVRDDLFIFIKETFFDLNVESDGIISIKV